MLTGPIRATKRALEKSGLTIDDIDLFECNEAFASVVLAWMKETGIPHEKVNVNGGGIALGHPIGATGTRIMAHAAQRARAHRRPLRPADDVRGRRPGQRDDHRAALTGTGQRWIARTQRLRSTAICQDPPGNPWRPGDPSGRLIPRGDHAVHPDDTDALAAYVEVTNAVRGRGLALGAPEDAAARPRASSGTAGTASRAPRSSPRSTACPSRSASARPASATTSTWPARRWRCIPSTGAAATARSSSRR